MIYRQTGSNTRMYPAGDSDDTADELPAETAMLFWTIQALASDTCPA
jgi:hypothetical protein